MVNTQILSESINPKSLAGFIRTHVFQNEPDRIKRSGSNNTSRQNLCGLNSKTHAQKEKTGPLLSEDAMPHQNTEQQNHRTTSLHADTLATTCALHMSDNDWRQAEKYFEKFAQ